MVVLDKVLKWQIEAALVCALSCGEDLEDHDPLVSLYANLAYF